jgi:hypothetical protein
MVPGMLPGIIRPMKHRLVIIFPIVVLILSLSYSLTLVISSNWQGFSLPVIISSLIPTKSISSAMNQYLPHTSPSELAEVVNQIRSNYDLKSLTSDVSVCVSTAENTHNYTACSQCSHAAIIKISNRAYPEQIKKFLIEDTTALNAIASPDITHYCTTATEGMLTLFIAKYDPDLIKTPQTSISKPAGSISQVTKPKVIKNFSEEELWQALVNYRHAHQRTDLLRDENLCQYARKRVQDHLSQYQTRSPEDYPVPDKYPLDAHEGFAADADSGLAFEMAGKNRLAENLAYWPGAEFANQIIEWGWDSSTEGHREAQLSENYSHACITGQDGFYVAIFGG